MIITKSKYVEYVMCPRKAWLQMFEYKESSDEENKRALEGERIHEVARQYFGKNKCILYDENNPTISPGIYAEYLLKYENLKCYCDIVIINKDGSFDIYEIKSVTNVNQKKYKEDISFQYYVATMLNINVNSINLMYLNKDYVYDGVSLDLKKLFICENFLIDVKYNLKNVKKNIDQLLMLNKNYIPDCPFSSYCNDYGGCQYFSRCKEIKKLPLNHSTYELYNCRKRTEYIEKGILSWKEIHNQHIYYELSKYNQIMIEKYVNNDDSIFVEKEKLKKMISSWEFPLYFFDFETCQEAIPIYKNANPYEQIPFQYSLHIMEDQFTKEDDIINNHKEFLGDGVNDPREELIKQMLLDLGNKGSIVAYNKSFEQTVILNLASSFPEYKDELLDIRKRFVDLRDVFSNNDFCLYHPKMENSTSIKKVLPAFFPDRYDLNYKNLQQIHHGEEALEAYKKLRLLNEDERNELKNNMLKYCCLDTKAMVVLYLKFRELCEM